jgi:two-component system response regulator NreC
VKTRIVIVDDHAVLRAGLRMFLNDQEDLEVVDEARNAEEALAAIAAALPDVVTLDVTLPGEGGLSLLKRLRQQLPQARVLVLTMHDGPEYLQAAIVAGAAGYVSKTADETEVLAAIRSIRQGRTYFSGRMDSGLRLGKSQTENAGDDTSVLSDREREVLALVARGLTNQEVAEALTLSIKTIEGYRSRLMSKLGLQSRAELVAYALTNGILSPTAIG